MRKIGFDPKKVIIYSKKALLPVLVMGVFLVYFFSVSDFSDKTYHSIHLLFLSTVVATFAAGMFRHISASAVFISIIYIGYLIINGTRYTYGEDYMFSASYNIWSILMLPNLLIAHFLFQKNKKYKNLSWFYIFLLAQTAVIERLQNQSIDADSYFFYKHIGMLNYPAIGVSVLCFIILLSKQISRGKILNAATLFSSISVFMALYFSDNLFAFSLFFFAAALISLLSTLYYAYYIQYTDEDLDIPNVYSFMKDAEKKYPLKYSIALLYIDEYERILKRFGAAKALMLKKMFLSRIRQTKPEILIYNYKTDALILAFMNANASESFDEAEEVRRLLAKSIFIFNENNHLQLTVSQCVSEFKRSDANAIAVLLRAEENLQKACKFTRNITVKA